MKLRYQPAPKLVWVWLKVYAYNFFSVQKQSSVARRLIPSFISCQLTTSTVEPISFSFIARTHPQNLGQETSGRLRGPNEILLTSCNTSGPENVECCPEICSLVDGFHQERDVAAGVVHQEEEDGDGRRSNLGWNDLHHDGEQDGEPGLSQIFYIFVIALVKLRQNSKNGLGQIDQL